MEKTYWIISPIPWRGLPHETSQCLVQFSFQLLKQGPLTTSDFFQEPDLYSWPPPCWLYQKSRNLRTHPAGAHRVLPAHNQTCKPLNPLSLLSVNFKIISLVTTPSVLSYSTFSASVHITSLLPWVFILAEESLWKKKLLFQRVKEHGL